MTLGKRILAARKRLVPELTQKKLASAFRISDKAVSAWERDETSPEVEKLPRLARELKVPLAWLLAGEGAPPDADSAETRIEQLTPADREFLNSMIDAMEKRRSNAA